MNEIASPTTKSKQTDPLITQIEADWMSVAHGGRLEYDLAPYIEGLLTGSAVGERLRR